MEKRKSFNKIYESDLLPEIERLDENRKYYKKKVLTFLVVPHVVLFILIYLLEKFLFTSEDSNYLKFYFFAWVLIYFIYRFIFKKYKNKFALEFKEKVIRRIIRSIDESLYYNPLAEFPKSQFLKSEIYNNTILYYGEDMVRGKIEQTPICFSEVQAKNRDNKGKLTTTFKGIFFEADFNKDFNNKTFVLTDKLERSFGHIGKMLQSLNSNRPPLVKLENPEFEKYFAVYSQDQVEARYILSTSLMERLTKFVENRKSPVALSFVDNSIFIAISEPKNLFEPTIMNSNRNKEMIKGYFNILELVIGIVEDLNLNNRIWAGSKMSS
ncbi:MAG: DUF3137 domain-containing protein [Bacteroidota bacterium]